jgi:hypothetical protein
MLSAEAARLAAIEVLSPTAANVAGSGWPTLAGPRIYDSRAAALTEIDDRLEYTPVVSVYSRSARATTRGEAAEFDDTDASIEIEFVAELATIVKPGPGDPEPFEPYPDAVAGDDPEARLVLAALCAQMRRLLCFAEEGELFRRFIRGIARVDWEPFAVPELGLRFQRTTMVLHCLARDDVFAEAAGLPEPLKTLHGRLPDGSYAKAKLTQLAAHFAAVDRAPLEDIRIGPGEGEDFTGSTGDLT